MGSLCAVVDTVFLLEHVEMKREASRSFVQNLDTIIIYSLRIALNLGLYYFSLVRGRKLLSSTAHRKNNTKQIDRKSHAPLRNKYQKHKVLY